MLPAYLALGSSAGPRTVNRTCPLFGPCRWTGEPPELWRRGLPSRCSGGFGLPHPVHAALDGCSATCPYVTVSDRHRPCPPSAFGLLTGARDHGCARGWQRGARWAPDGRAWARCSPTGIQATANRIAGQCTVRAVSRRHSRRDFAAAHGVLRGVVVGPTVAYAARFSTLVVGACLRVGRRAGQFGGRRTDAPNCVPYCQPELAGALLVIVGPLCRLPTAY